MKTSPVTRIWRLSRLTIHFLLGLLEVALLFPSRSAPARERAIVRWSRRLCDILSIQVIVDGTPPSHTPANTMLVANHISWLDIFVLDTVTASHFVAKAEVRNWPLIGWLCQQTGTLFVTRERRHDTHRVNRQISTALSRGSCVAVFPEGSTSNGLATTVFNASLLQPAVDSKANVLPVALRYFGRDKRRSLAAAYVGEMSLFDSLLQLVTEPRLEVRLTYFPTIAAGESNRRDLARHTELLIGGLVKQDAIIATTDTAPAEMAPERPAYPPGELP